MSVLIKGMEMPSHCTECDFWHDGIFEHCMLNDEIQNEDVPFNDGEYPRDCPLIELPPHGRLIDADALNDLINKSYPMTDRVDVHNGYAICQIMIKDLPTIIPAEEES